MVRTSPPSCTLKASGLLCNRRHSPRCVRDRYTAWRDRVLRRRHMRFSCADSARENRLPSSAHLSGLRFSAAAYFKPVPTPLRFFDLLLERSAAPCRGLPWTKSGGRVIVPFSSMARDARGPILLPSRTRSANRQSSGRGADFPWHTSWGCSMRAPGCS